MKRSATSDLAAELLHAEPGRRLTLLRAAWPAAVGPELARRSEPVALDGDLLLIRVPDAIWRRSLWRMRKDLLSRLRRIAGSAAPHALGFIEGPVTAAVEPPTPRTRPVAPGPLPPTVDAAAESIPDEDTRERFRETVGRYLARFPPQTTAGEGEDDAG